MTEINEKLLPSLEERVARIEKWIDFWETIETGWNTRAPSALEAECNALRSGVKEGIKGLDMMVSICQDSLADHFGQKCAKQIRKSLKALKTLTDKSEE